MPNPAVRISMAACLAAAPVSAIPQAATPGAAAPRTSDNQAAPATWYSSGFDAAVQVATRAGAPLLGYFWMPDSQHCANLWSETLDGPAAAARLSGLTCFSADVTTGEGHALAQRFGVRSLPAVLLFDRAGRPDEAIWGHVPTAEFDRRLALAQAGTGTVSALRERASGAPDDLDLRFTLAAKLLDVGDRDGGQLLFDSIRTADPNGATIGGARLLLRDATDAAQATLSAAPDPAAVDLQHVYAVVESLRHDVVAFAGWSWLAQTEEQRGDGAAARRALDRGWERAGDPPPPLWPAQVADTYWRTRADLGDDEAHSLLQRVARAVADHPATAAKERALQLVAWARAHALTGDRGEARRLADAALELAPGDPELREAATALVQ